MEILFHLPTLVALAAVQARLRLDPTPAAWLKLTAAWGGIAALCLVMALGPHRFAFLRGAAWLLFAYLPIHALLSARTLGGRARGSRTADGAGSRRRLAGRLKALATLLLMTAAWAFLVEPRWLEITRFTVESEKLGRALRVAVISDLQTDRIAGHERRALEAALAARPDLVLLPGDYLQIDDPAARAREAARLRELLEELRFTAPLGVIAVRGDVEQDGWQSIFAGTGVQTYEKTTRLELGDLVVTALSPRDSRMRRAWLPRTERFHLAFGHAPEFALDQDQLDRPTADLLIAGHTHGGQVRLPFLGPLITLSDVPRSWAAGRTDLANGATLIVSRGVGMERGRAPRLRFLCRPEVTIVDLVPAQGSSARRRSS
ncbi:MAG: metallophosphoesterase [Acidobacteriota bacterium]